MTTMAYHISHVMYIHLSVPVYHIGYEPADLTVHPPPKTIEGGFIFLYRCLVFPNKCPQRKACTFLSYPGYNTQKRVFLTYSLKPNFDKLNIIK